MSSRFSAQGYLRAGAGESGDGCGDNGREMAHHFALVLLVPSVYERMKIKNE